MFSPTSRYRTNNCYGDAVTVTDAAAMRHDLRTLKSQVYEVCRQSASDHNLCERIKSSIDTNNSNLYYSSSSYSPRYNLSSGVGSRTVLDNKNNATVTVVDTVKY
ncbi:hypothetical protein [Alphabaculovirus altersperidaniae]|uniref:Uncharacterized protein n=1 Tax=Spodoptera eridania nucleopolyhedrovirus TaxID=2315721 RepID=A0ABX6TRB6_9ABAC|nr:hypothetical protein QKS47_gp014 [Spodoptera eridania nucleopolyhedrovirus]QNV47774.1 hypothetical protein [Spodoptera eridania nucleopolyhedrovirus]